ncbi:DUF262 domain-containing protein [Brevundimonas goettingensis]|uniref:DUF262 domain-containing protein n=1 Tax=Brevundimonas goettingensis TaxID=2774190 RepID=A0A975GUN5_9CAUL|nr:DUF262 domain-containing protein [Brevundimonas goettingensis]QTC90402.1 DUF262 domain-containing protein [Brevundimonas goettingensis]
MSLLPQERAMWERYPLPPETALSDGQISEKYLRGEGRIVLENNREKLPGFVEQLERYEYMDLRPFYQRRPKWDVERQSRLIESFIINVPVPPVFLYERNFNSFEVMDGQQRITAIRDFYNNKFALKGLQYWPELNGKRYHSLPSVVRSGIDRRSISSIVMLKESAYQDDEAAILRQIVFERLNTGGVELKRQEIRNAMYQGAFNDALLDMSKNNVIRDAWGLPRYDPEEMSSSDAPILKKSFFSDMEDVEIVLRFFALRCVDQYRGGMQNFLDQYMVRSRDFSDSDISQLQYMFDKTVWRAGSIFGDRVFCSFDPKKDRWTQAPQKAIFDAVMVALSNIDDPLDDLAKRRDLVVDETRRMILDNPPGTFTGRGNTKKDIIARIGLFEALFRRVISL